MRKTLAKYRSLAREWHPTLNGDLRPNDFTYGSEVEVWWRCPNGHDYKAKIKARTKKRSPKKCRQCKSLAFLYPDITRELHPTKNGDINPFWIASTVRTKVWWLCPECEHPYEARVGNRTLRGSGCPACAGKVVTEKNRLTELFPEIAQEWDVKKNGSLLSTEVSVGSDKKVWWVCTECGESFQQPISKRTNRGDGCPSCSGRVVSDTNRLSLIAPHLIDEWNFEKNAPLKPEDCSFGSGQKVWWRCKRGHEWEALIKNRTNGAGCPDCHPQSSRLEIRVYVELLALFGNVEWKRKKSGIEIDVYLTDFRIGIEIDGSYWHSGNEKRDKNKNSRLQELGISLIRVREHPLRKISSHDVTVSAKAPQKEVIDNVLINLTDLYSASSLKTKVKRYLKREDFIDEDGFKTVTSALPGHRPMNHFCQKEKAQPKSGTMRLTIR